MVHQLRLAHMMNALAGLKRRIAHITVPLSIAITAPSLHHPQLLATRELLDAVLGGQEELITPAYRTDPTLDGVRVQVKREGRAGPVSFWGTPSGYELEGLVLALESLQDPFEVHPALTPAESELLSQISRPLNADLYVAPT